MGKKKLRTDPPSGVIDQCYSRHSRPCPTGTPVEREWLSMSNTLSIQLQTNKMLLKIKFQNYINLASVIPKNRDMKK
jgi:hypothetical protein